VTVREIHGELLDAAGARVQSPAGGTEAWRQAGHPIETGH
jgi:hypothetical protein